MYICIYIYIYMHMNKFIAKKTKSQILYHVAGRAGHLLTK